MLELETIFLTKTDGTDDGEDFAEAFGDGVSMPTSPSPEEDIGVGDLGEGDGEVTPPPDTKIPDDGEGPAEEW